VFRLAGASSRNALLGEAGAHNIFGVFNVKYGLHIELHERGRASRRKVKRACLFSGRRSND